MARACQRELRGISIQQVGDHSAEYSHNWLCIRQIQTPRECRQDNVETGAQSLGHNVSFFAVRSEIGSQVLRDFCYNYSVAGICRHMPQQKMP